MYLVKIKIRGEIMRRQEYPDKAPYKHFILVKNGAQDKEIEEQLKEWHENNPSFSIGQHQYTYVGGTEGNGIEILELTYFDLAEAEKDVDPEYRTPRNEFYFKKIVDPLSSGESKVTDWYNENDIDIISKVSFVDTVNLEIVTGIVYVQREEAKAAYDLKYERQQKQIQKMSEEMAKKQINKETDKRMK